MDITFVNPGGWPVCLDKVRLWGGKPDADIFLGAGAPAHELAKKEGLIVPYQPKDWDKVPAQWGGMKVKDADYYWTCFAPWIVTNLYNEKVLSKLQLPPPKTWNDLLDPIYRGQHRAHIAVRIRYHARDDRNSHPGFWRKRGLEIPADCWRHNWPGSPPAVPIQPS